MGETGGGGETRKSSDPDKPLKKTEMVDFVRNVTDAQALANEMGASEDRTIVVSADGTERPLSEDEQRFALKKDSPHFAGQDVGDEEYYTKPFEQKKKLRPDGTEKDDRAKSTGSNPKLTDKFRQIAEIAKGSDKEEATPVETAQETVTQLADTTVSAEAANRPRSEAENEAIADKNVGAKSGTIATSPSGISNEDTSGLRPKKSAMARVGLLADDDDPKKKKTLIA